MDLLSIIILCVAIAKIFKKNDPKKYEETVRKAKDLGGEVLGEIRGKVQAQNSRTTSTYEQVNMHNYQKAQTVERKSTREENDLARQQVHQSRMEAEKTSILQRAKANAEEDKEDVTLRSLEESHGHSAKVAPAVHNHPEEEVMDNSMEKIQDLMVKGYEADLCFERDFLGEAMDMVNRFSMGGSV